MTAVPTIAEAWDELVTVALLGTDRRDPPELPPGPLADLVDDAVRPTSASRLLAAVAATVVARRCGATPRPPLAPLQPPPIDRRPLLPVAAARRWHRLVAEWPVLEAEWLGVAAAAGWRPPADVLVGLLRRHRRQPAAAAAVMAFGGTGASWLVEHVPDLAPTAGAAADAGRFDAALPVPPELEPFVDRPGAALVDHLARGLVDGSFRWSHRTVVLNAIARMPADGLAAAAETLTHRRPEGDGGQVAMWEALGELAATRRAMLDELVTGASA
jgi:hypothetical protein